MNKIHTAGIALGVILLGAAAYLHWRPEAAPPASDVATAPASASPAVEAPSSPASAPDSHVALDLPRDVAPLTEQGLGEALEALVGRQAALTALQTDDFARRAAATLDNLGRERAPASIWPVRPTPGRFTVVEQHGSPVISPDNAQRYTPFVQWLEAIDTARAAELYVRAYPLLQKAYQDLGYPNGYFNDRVLRVIDLLLATPEPEWPVRLQLLDVKGPVASTRPWVRYQYADPDLESLAAGQKLLIRTGPVNERRLKSKLRDFRQHLLEHRQR